MNHDVQSWLALGVVVGTLVVFVSRMFRKKKSVGGCPSCGGGSKPIAKAKVH